MAASAELVEAVVNLPHWARVAFAARCARHVAPLLSQVWPEAADQRRQAYRRAVYLAESSASAGHAEQKLDEAVNEAAQAAKTALRVLYGQPPPEPLPENGDAATVAATIFKVAELAAAAARSTTQESPRLAAEAFRHATDAAASAPDPQALLKNVEADLGRLRRMARFESWNDTSPIPVGLFR